MHREGFLLNLERCFDFWPEIGMDSFGIEPSLIEGRKGYRVFACEISEYSVR